MSKKLTAAAMSLATGIGLGPLAAQAQDFVETEAPAEATAVEFAAPEAAVEAAPEAAAELATQEAAVVEAPASESVETYDTIALSEEAPAPVAVDHEPAQAGLNEVIVTAQRREQSAQDVPISITVLDQQQLSNANITNSADLATYTPSLSTNQRFGPENATFAIRGFTQDLRTTASVGVYFAEVVAPRGQSSQTSGDGAGPGELFDLENVQVLKGPQGTLFGRNTTGGAVLIVPKKPTDYFEGYGEVSAGDYGMRRLQVVLNTPLTDSFKVRLGIDANKRDGHLRNIAEIGTKELGNVEYISGRLSTLWNITDDIENYTILSYAHSDTYGNTSQLYRCNPNLIDPSNGKLSPFYLFVGSQCQDQLNQQAANGQNGYYDLVSSIASPMNKLKTMRGINTTTFRLNDDLQLKNIFSYAHLHTENGSDIFGTRFRYALTVPVVANLGNLPILGPILDRLDTVRLDPNPNREFKIGISVPNKDVPVTSQRTLVEELQLQGTSFDGALTWQTGAYFEKSMPDGASGNNSIALVSCDLSTIEGDPSQFDCFDPLMGVLGGVLTQKLKTTYLNRAVYAEGTYEFNDAWSATLGARYTWDRTEGHGVKTRYTYALSVPLAPKEQITTPKVSSRAPTGQFQLAYKPAKDVMTYAKYVRGYRQGNVILAADPGIDTFDPEHINSYELGAKTSFRGVIPGRFNVALFHNDLSDMQLQYGYVSSTAQTTTTIVNAGKARVSGAEVEMFIQPLRGLTWGLSYSYLDTKLVKFNTNQPAVAAVAIPGTATPIAVEGDTLPFAPDHTVATTLTYTLPLSPAIGMVDVGATYVYTGERRSSATGSSPDAVLDPFSLVNANINWTSMFGSDLDLSLFATNIFDEKYITYASGTYYTLNFDSRQVGLPRMMGARLRYNFGR